MKTPTKAQCRTINTMLRIMTRMSGFENDFEMKEILDLNDRLMSDDPEIARAAIEQSKRRHARYLRKRNRGNK